MGESNGLNDEIYCHKGSILFFFYEHFIWPGLSTITFTFFLLTAASFSFSFEKKTTMDLGNPKVQEWENLMWKYQQKLPFAKEGEKWILMDKIYQL